jgi:shikimate dehydrogenase
LSDELRRLAVLGHPVSHSRSPAMQTAALEALGLADKWSYEAIDVEPERFEELVRAMPAQGFAGANVTVPHKLAALAIADEASAAAREIGAANTLSFADGRIEAENTDAPGLVAALGIPLVGVRTLVLGAGGSARAAIWALRNEGAEVRVWNRTAAKAERLASELGATVADLDDEAARADQVIVNATTVGMAQAGETPGPTLKALPIAADAVTDAHVVVDLAYGSADTELVRLARERGARVVDGLDVLVHQGAASLRLWTGSDPPLEAMSAAARAPIDGNG